jgi:hypothetical protein
MHINVPHPNQLSTPRNPGNLKKACYGTSRCPRLGKRNLLKESLDLDAQWDMIVRNTCGQHSSSKLDTQNKYHMKFIEGEVIWWR